jgi:CDP-diacylglycerol--glycerol-3-phosphate 3-phosphatidyltransferase
MNQFEKTPSDEEESSIAEPIEPRDEAYKDSIVTIPNLICFARLIGSFVLFAFAVVEWRIPFVALFIVLSLSDWIDGKLARWLHQRSDFGARLDSLADAALYAGLIGGVLLLSWQKLQGELIWWIIVGIFSYALTTGAGIWKYGRIPSYHTYGAKVTQWFALLAGGFVILDGSDWPIRIAMIALTLTNLEATAITFVLKEWRADVLTLFHVWPKDIHAKIMEDRAAKQRHGQRGAENG